MARTRYNQDILATTLHPWVVPIRLAVGRGHIFSRVHGRVIPPNTVRTEEINKWTRGLQERPNDITNWANFSTEPVPSNAAEDAREKEATIDVDHLGT
ncbi:unnamed protein product [Aspergillus oryzae]|uniref:Unnamed protein product n=2 Tax=Aspergillus oryzae TaxID=5062 RepID=A0AAN5BUV1_ASPOZ|nr:unnamed protein product [Aspergillus oryzae]GMF90479.1 unnamed protein product [Aspergillus oryzae]GMG07490.1 unnamed protein product [Aspergillus oryzae]GMG25908.1 unnamed protein product [Aspergillus oryzae]GMG50999.1 unnamed protein product [Aspergillus oryzae var. brunneus]